MRFSWRFEAILAIAGLLLALASPCRAVDDRPAKSAAIDPQASKVLEQFGTYVTGLRASA